MALEIRRVAKQMSVLRDHAQNPDRVFFYA